MLREEKEREIGNLRALIGQVQRMAQSAMNELKHLEFQNDEIKGEGVLVSKKMMILKTENLSLRTELGINETKLQEATLRLEVQAHLVKNLESKASQLGSL